MRYALALLLLALVTPAHADTIAVGDWVRMSDAPGANAPNGGGAFTVTGPSDSWVSFCLEATETINFSQDFYVAGISDAAMGGGPGSSRPTSSSQTTGPCSCTRSNSMSKASTCGL